MIAVFQWTAVALYAVAGYQYFRAFQSGDQGSGRSASTWLLAACGLHLLLLAGFSVNTGRLPVATVSEAASTFVWLTAQIFWFIERGVLVRRQDNRSMGTFILPVLVALLVFSNLTYSAHEPIAPVLTDIKFELHVVAMLLGYGAFTLSFIASLLYTLLSREIQRRAPGVFYSKLPSLAFFDRISSVSVDVGLIFASLGFAVGFYFAARVWGSFMFTEPKIIAALFSWFVYCLHLAGRRFVGWHGQVAASISLVGFGLLLFSFLVISLLFTSVHRFV